MPLFHKTKGSESKNNWGNPDAKFCLKVLLRSVAQQLYKLSLSMESVSSLAIASGNLLVVFALSILLKAISRLVRSFSIPSSLLGLIKNCSTRDSAFVDLVLADCVSNDSVSSEIASAASVSEEMLFNLSASKFSSKVSSFQKLFQIRKPPVERAVSFLASNKICSMLELSVCENSLILLIRLGVAGILNSKFKRRAHRKACLPMSLINYPKN